MVDKKIFIDDNCIKCGICAESCPFEAIEIEQTDNKLDNEFENHKGVMVFCETRFSKANKVAYELLSEGRRIADDLQVNLSAVIIGNDIANEVRKLIAYGADYVYIYENRELEYFNDEIVVNIITSIINEQKPEIVLFSATIYGKSIAPRIASRLNVGLTADCTELSLENRLLIQTRPAFGGNIMATIISPNKKPQMVTVRPGVMKESIPDYTRKAEIIKNSKIHLSGLKTKVIESINYNNATKKIVDSEIIIGIGRGIKDQKNIQLIEDLAQILGASIGASRAIVDAGWISHDQQIGQSGITVRPKIYIACGISGAIQHLAGILNTEIIIAINKDIDAPIFKIARYGVVGDVMEVVPAIIKELKLRNINNGFSISTLMTKVNRNIS